MDAVSHLHAMRLPFHNVDAIQDYFHFAALRIVTSYIMKVARVMEIFNRNCRTRPSAQYFKIIITCMPAESWENWSCAFLSQIFKLRQTAF